MEINYLPVPKQNQLIIPYDFQEKKYQISEHDMKILQRYFKEKVILEKIKKDIGHSKSLNPFQNSCLKSTLKVILWIFHLMFLFLFIYIWIAIFLLLLGDPVIIVLYGYFIIYMLWYRGFRLAIEIILDYGKSSPLQNYLKSINKKYFNRCGISWTVCQGGKWLKVDYQMQLKK